MLSLNSALKFAFVLSASLSLSACFTPVYKPQSGQGDTASFIQNKLAQVEPSLQHSRVGLELRNELNFALDNANVPAQYVLDMNIRETGIISITDPVTGRAEAYATGLRVTYQLKKKSDPKVVIMSSTAIADTTYDRPQQRFAALRSARDSQHRAARTVAQQIYSQLVAYFRLEQDKK